MYYDYSAAGTNKCCIVRYYVSISVRRVIGIVLRGVVKEYYGTKRRSSTIVSTGNISSNTIEGVSEFKPAESFKWEFNFSNLKFVSHAIQ